MATLPVEAATPRSCRSPLRMAAPWLLIAVLLTALGQPPLARAAPSVHIYAAASLSDALDAAIARYEASHAARIVPVYAASSTAARQIAHGAPAELYFSANERWMNWLGEQGITLTERSDLLHNQLVLIAPRDGDTRPITLDGNHELAARLGDGRRLAVGDPAHVPAGIYAKQALHALGEWQALEPRLARADNVRAALALVERGEAPLGIVYKTDARASNQVHELATFPADSHPPINYPLALVGASPSEAARAFREWLASEQALAIFHDFGFTAAAPGAH
ncbi:molybdate ABC transporter substrate-binding protein [Halomonas sp. HP20-15]|uniref:molybdate ABC transporter substrate-binding protein n=1 Tax=Halomonas sp. HP20-15 TaxID=3085901 RepID=UPI0029820D68|nr:molybdate ABC transporter substrate-binding protein [Halomonas sp. HP20-15]MDW5377865.1 molybdate ABC transporter substrate-binding protein [Halomonas sp. HP20-15]